MTNILEEVSTLFRENNDIKGVDLLISNQEFDKIIDYVHHKDSPKASNLKLIQEYMTQYAASCDPSYQSAVLAAIYDIWLKHGEPVKAFNIALKMANYDRIHIALVHCIAHDESEFPLTKQALYLLSEAGSPLNKIVSNYALIKDSFAATENNQIALSQDAIDIALGRMTHHHTQLILCALGLQDAMSVADIFKAHLLTRSLPANTVSHKFMTVAQILASAFANTGCGNDALMKNDGHFAGNLTKSSYADLAVGSLGMVHLYNTQGSANAFAAYAEHFPVARVLAHATAFAGAENDFNSTYVLAAEQLRNQDLPLDQKCSLFLSLGIAYFGSNDRETMELIANYIDLENIKAFIPAVTAICLIAAGTHDMDLFTEYCSYVSAFDKDLLLGSFELPVLVMALSMIFYRAGEMEVPPMIYELLPEEFTAMFESVFLAMTQAGTGNLAITSQLIDQLQAYMIMTRKSEGQKTREGKLGKTDVKDLMASMSSTIAEAQVLENETANLDIAPPTELAPLILLSIAIVNVGDEISSTMILRLLEKLYQFVNKDTKRAFPLACALLYAGTNKQALQETLFRWSRDHDDIIAMNSIFAIGIVFAGSRNNRVEAKLRSITTSASTRPKVVYACRIAAGMIHLGRGILTFGTDSPKKIAGLSIFLTALSQWNVFFQDDFWSFWNLLSLSIEPKYLLTLDTKGYMANVKVNIGQFVNTVGQKGEPRNITGFQTNDTPSLLSKSDFCVLCHPDQDQSYAPELRGTVIVSKISQSKPKELHEELD